MKDQTGGPAVSRNGWRCANNRVVDSMAVEVDDSEGLANRPDNSGVKPTIPVMNDYQQEQLAAFSIVRKGLLRMEEVQRQRLIGTTADYMQFRRSVDDFLFRHFDAVCTRACYRSRTSACCSKDGIITFFADAVVNVLHASEAQVDALIRALGRVNTGHRCVYLGDDGCMWTVRPVVCAMFLCDRAEKTVFAASPGASARWEALKAQEKRFKWPDRPVLFDYLEKVFLDMGFRSTLMHLNMSPGLLRVKRNAGLIQRPNPSSSCG